MIKKKRNTGVCLKKTNKKRRGGCRLEVCLMTARHSTRLRESKISNAHAKNSRKRPSLRLNCLHNLADLSLFFFEPPYRHCLRPPLCSPGVPFSPPTPPTPPSFFLTCGGSYLRRPRRWIIPLTTNPFATVEGMRAPVGSPPGPAGASSSSPSSGLPG